MSQFEPQDLNFEQRTRASFSQQAVMTTVGASMDSVKAGQVTIVLPFRDDLTQQDGFLHAGIVTTIVDSACGYAAFTLMSPDARVLTVEYKVNFLRPAAGERFVAIGEVLKPGRHLTVCEGRVLAYIGETEKQIVAMQATMIAMRG